MTTLLPLLALVLAVLGFVLGRPPEVPERPPLPRAVAALLALLAGALATYKFVGVATKADAAQSHAIVEALALGVVLAGLAAYLPKRSNAEAAYLALGTAGPAFLLWLSPDLIRLSGLALIAGYGFAALALADEMAILTAVSGSFVTAATVIGRYGSDAPSFMHAPIALGMGLSLLGLMKSGIAKMSAKPSAITNVGVRILALGLAYAIGKRYLGLGEAWISMALALGAGLAVWAAMPNEEIVEAGRGALSAIIWIGLGTLAFGLARAYGMALGLLVAGGVHLILGERRALMSMGPLLGLVLYRLFREAHMDASRALDIGQHYALIGLALGAVTPILPERWWFTKPKSEWLQSIGGFLWCLVWAALPVLTALLLGPKGVVGWVVGVGFSTLFTIVSEGASLLPLAAAAGAGGLAALTFGWLTDLTNLARDEKLHWIFYGVGPLALVAIVLAVLGYKKPEKPLQPVGAL
jgi:hypothetical protein